MLATAPQAFKDYALFLFNYTGGRCGNVELLDPATVKQIRVRRTTATEVQKLFGHKHLIKRIPGGEIWYFRGSVTSFQLPDDRSDRAFIGKAETVVRTLELEFDLDGLLRRKKTGKYAREGTARL